MSPNGPDNDGFERGARAILEESILRIDGKVRSRLAHARHAAVAESLRSRFLPRLDWVVAPAAGAVAAAVVVAVVLWTGRLDRWSPVTESQSPFDDIELLADRDAFDLLEEWDSGFYEWAAAQGELGAEGGG